MYFFKLTVSANKTYQKKCFSKSHSLVSNVIYYIIFEGRKVDNSRYCPHGYYVGPTYIHMDTGPNKVYPLSLFRLYTLYN